MKYAPVAIFVYNRADHFEQTFRALAACPEARETELFIFSDGPKNEAGADKVRAVREKVRELTRGGAFQSVTLRESERNRGLAASIISGVTEVMEKRGRAIVLEDDCVASPHFLRYMNACLSYYEADQTVGSIAGFSPALEALKRYPQDVFAAYRSCSCSWASWCDRWANVDWGLEGFRDFCRSRKLVKRFNAEGNDRFLRLYRQAVKGGSSWSVRFGMHLVRNDMMTIYPRYSYITNIGCDDSGVHSSEGDAELMSVDIEKAIPDPKPVPPVINQSIQRAMKKHYSGDLPHSLAHELAAALLAARVSVTGVRHG